MKLSILIKMT